MRGKIPHWSLHCTCGVNLVDQRIDFQVLLGKEHIALVCDAIGNAQTLAFFDQSLLKLQQVQEELLAGGDDFFIVALSQDCVEHCLNAQTIEDLLLNGLQELIMIVLAVESVIVVLRF
jgi:hypothetical protein